MKNIYIISICYNVINSDTRNQFLNLHLSRMCALYIFKFSIFFYYIFMCERETF